MAATKYTYSISGDFDNGLNTARLEAEILASSITKGVKGINTEGDDCDVWFKEAISSEEETVLDGLVAAHDGTPLVQPRLVAIKEEDVQTGGHFQARGIAWDVPATEGWNDLDPFSWPHPISLLAAETFGRSGCNEDKVEFLVAPGTVVGSITADVVVDDTEISVSATALANLCVGKLVELDDGTNSNNLGRVLAVDTADGKITVETAATQAFAAATPTYVKMTTKMGYDVELTEGHRIAIGESKIGGSYISANVPIAMRYFNKDGTAKRFAVVVEYLY
jgi:hypothetical protein